jgi:DNA-binding protein HU-beta
MNKAELVDVISEKLNITKKEVEDVIDSATDVITKKLKEGQEVTLTGFGAFSARTRKGRIGVNPRNPSEKIEIPSVVVPKFKAGKNLKEALKAKEQEQAPAETPKEPPAETPAE